MCLYDFDFQSIVSPRKCVYLNLEGGRETYHKDTKKFLFFWLLGQIKAIDDDKPSHPRLTS